MAIAGGIRGVSPVPHILVGMHGGVRMVGDRRPTHSGNVYALCLRGSARGRYQDSVSLGPVGGQEQNLALLQPRPRDLTYSEGSIFSAENQAP
jgi:hypothetical protein